MTQPLLKQPGTGDPPISQEHRFVVHRIDNGVCWFLANMNERVWSRSFVHAVLFASSSEAFSCIFNLTHPQEHQNIIVERVFVGG